VKQVNETDNDQIFNDKQRTSLEEERASDAEVEEAVEEAAEDIPLEHMTKAQLIEKVQALEAEKEENRDLYLRAKADTENMKRRFQKEKQDLVKYGTETLIKQLLPVADNLEKAIAHSQEKVSLKTLQEGVNLTLKGFMDTLKKAGVAPIEAVGEPFDPNFHEAMSEIEAKDAEPGTVVNEFQKGYTLNDRLLRPSMVVISKKPA